MSTVIPAVEADWTPASESSRAMQAVGGNPKRRAASK